MILSHNYFLSFTQNDIFHKGQQKPMFRSSTSHLCELCNFESLNFSKFLYISFFFLVWKKRCKMLSNNIMSSFICKPCYKSKYWENMVYLGIINWRLILPLPLILGNIERATLWLSFHLAVSPPRSGLWAGEHRAGECRSQGVHLFYQCCYFSYYVHCFFCFS